MCIHCMKVDSYLEGLSEAMNIILEQLEVLGARNLEYTEAYIALEGILLLIRIQFDETIKKFEDSKGERNEEEKIVTLEPVNFHPVIIPTMKDRLN